MTKGPLVSILIPVHNRVSMIEECVQSALRQTYQDTEVVVVDNASSDGTWKVCQRLALLDARVRVFRNDTNIGPVRNWRRCIDEAKGEYAKFLFSDDLMRPRFLEVLMPVVVETQVGLAFCAIEIGAVEGEGVLSYVWAPVSGCYESERFIKDALFGERIPVSPGAMLCRLADLRASLHERLPGVPLGDFAAHGAGSDLLTLLLTAQRYRAVGFVSQALVFFRTHPGSITTQNARLNTLVDYYRQAMVWFSMQHKAAELAGPLFLCLWLIEVKHGRRWLSPKSVKSRYGFDQFPIRLGDLGKCLAFWLRAKQQLLPRKRLFDHFSELPVANDPTTPA